MKKLIILIIALFITSSLVFSQQQPTPTKLTEFSFMIGEWEGTGKYFTQQGVNEFKVAESITYAVDSTVLLINGKGVDNHDVTHHEAFGVLYLDGNEHRMHAFTMQGSQVIAQVTKTGDKSFNWGFDLPNGGTIKYQTVFTDTTWDESGTYTLPDGSQSFPVVNMSLTRKSN